MLNWIYYKKDHKTRVKKSERIQKGIRHTRKNNRQKVLFYFEIQ